MSSNILTWGLAGLLLLSGAANVLLWQRGETLRERNRALSALRAQVQELQEQAGQIDQLKVDYDELQKLRRDTVELARLRNETAQARTQGSEMAKLQAQLSDLTRQLKAAREALAQQRQTMQDQVAASVESAIAVDQAARAASIKCVSNLKQVALGLIMWANDHNEILPQELPLLVNELNRPAVLTCPSDNLRTPVQEWAQFVPAVMSYQYQLPNVSLTQVNVEQPMVTCPIHGHVARADGSVLSGEAPAEAPQP